VVMRRGRGKTVCARGPCRAWSCGPSTSPLESSMKTWLSTLALCLVTSAGRAGDHLTVPREAFELTKAHGCEPIADFFDNRPAVEDPPYALVSGDMRKLQIAVWCTTDSSKPEGQRTYLLLLRVDDVSSPLAGCPSEVRRTRRIGGLRFVDISDDLKYYYYVDTGKQVASAGKLHTKGVESSYDGVGERYACIDGKWAFNAYD